MEPIVVGGLEEQGGPRTSNVKDINKALTLKKQSCSVTTKKNENGGQGTSTGNFKYTPESPQNTGDIF